MFVGISNISGGLGAVPFGQYKSSWRAVENSASTVLSLSFSLFIRPTDTTSKMKFSAGLAAVATLLAANGVSAVSEWG